MTAKPGRSTKPAAPATRRAGGPKHAPRIPFALIVVGLLGGGLVLLLGLNTASAANEVRRHDLAARDSSLSADLAQARNDLAASNAPNVLAQAAGDLGMVPAGNPAFITIGPDGKARVIGKGAPATAIPLPAIVLPATGGNTPAPAPTSSSSSAGGHSGSASSSPHPTPSPTPSTTTVTLPGGPR